MTEDEPTTYDLLAAANRLCPYCRQRARAFLGKHERYPHFTNREALELVTAFYRQCCQGPITG